MLSHVYDDSCILLLLHFIKILLLAVLALTIDSLGLPGVRLLLLSLQLFSCLMGLSLGFSVNSGGHSGSLGL